jgi:hypothetical protein
MRECVDDTFALRDLLTQSDSLSSKVRRLCWKYIEISLEGEEIRNP